MIALNKLLLVVLISSLCFANCEYQSLKDVDIETNITDTNPSQMAVLTQLKTTKSDSGDSIYSYKCTVGTYSSNLVGCTAQDSTSWTTPHNVELKLRCPNSGSGLTLSSVEIYYSVTSNNVNCFVNEGAVGLGYIGVSINAWNTLLFSYSANFYTY